ncbi:hypothetical protein SCUCBS95973_005467 [Sporothrix curviconia]|uniref:Beta-xylosidase C-terminal Concanavalin A-like domain-containing protein n=1 Tax=Sporothrix curviconia TaxID=1260050 RepID=A0ABP0BX95_9PEZI
MAPAPFNPIIPGFSPDPSMVKVGDWFFLVNSTFHMFPGLPIYASRDLLSWKQIGNAIHRKDQLSLATADTRLTPLYEAGKLTEVMACTGGLYAPTIRHHNGRFYVVCTNVIHDTKPVEDGKQPQDTTENFIVSTGDIWAGDWSSPTYFTFTGIDPSLFFDDDGKVYIQGSAAPGPYTTIRQVQIDLTTGAALSDERLLWKGTGDIYPEGPHMYKRKGWYYLLISEGGTHEGHMITMARSRDIWGPYSECPHNPILTARGTDEYIRYTGHCDILEDDKGQWWGVCLGVRKDAGGRFIMGRESFLTRGQWDDEDWLTLERVKSNPSGLARTTGTGPLAAAAAQPNIDFLFIRDANLKHHRLSDDGFGSMVTLTGTPVDLSAPHESPTFVGKRQRSLYGKASVAFADITLDTWKAWTAAQLKCGLAVFKDEHRYVRIFVDATTGQTGVVFEFVNTAQKRSRAARHELGETGHITSLSLRIEYTEQEYRLLYNTTEATSSDDGWTCVDTVDTLHMTDPDFVGPVVGVFATSACPVDVGLRGLSVD